MKPSKLEERIELARHIKGYWLRFHQMPSVCSHKVQQELASVLQG